MSIPSYQFPSLAGENIAKRRVMKKAKEGFQTEEQRAIKSGKIGDDIKGIYKSIIANLELQISTIITATALTETIEQDVTADIVSYLIATIGKLVNLARQLTILIGSLGDMIRKTGNPANPSVDIGKIFSLMDEVDRKYGKWDLGEEEGTGLQRAFSIMIDAFNEEEDGTPPQIEGLLEIFEVANDDNREMLLKLQRNEYGADLKDVQIPIREGRNVNPDRARDIATGEERRNFTADEYRMLVELKRRGYLRDDDFTSVYSGEDATIFSGSSGTSYTEEDSSDEDDSEGDSEGDSDDDTGVSTASFLRGDRSVASSRSSSSRGNTSSSSSRGSSYNPFGDFRYVPRASKPTYFDGSSSSSTGSGLYSIPQQPKRGTNMASGYAIPVRYN